VLVRYSHLDRDGATDTRLDRLRPSKRLKRIDDGATADAVQRTTTSYGLSGSCRFRLVLTRIACAGEPRWVSAGTLAVSGWWNGVLQVAFGL
jgi:hypothetical protein